MPSPVSELYPLRVRPGSVVGHAQAAGGGTEKGLYVAYALRHPRGLEIARRLVAMCDIVAEGFSPGVLDSWGLGYEALRAIKPDIIYVQQSGIGAQGLYGRFRTVGPIANSFSGLSEMSGLPEPAMPAGWGYSYLDWMGAYSFALAMLSGLFHRARTGEGQWIDASQSEVGLFISGTTILDWSANGRIWSRSGNRSPNKPAAPHGAYPCLGDDRWLAIACFTEAEWRALAEVAGHAEWAEDARFRDLASRLRHQDALDALVGQWTRSQDAAKAMLELQQAGVPAGVCRTAEDRCDHDPQLAALPLADQGGGHEDRPLADRRGAGQDEREPRLHRRAPRPVRALLRRGQRVRLRRAARDVLEGDRGAGRRRRDLSLSRGPRREHGPG
jgi:crotonobetainyl-CoA:carnitine CoA-transferase CaiB-like acyl-CoA transferase